MTKKKPVTRAGWIRMGIIIGALVGVLALKNLICYFIVRANKRRRQKFNDHNRLVESQFEFKVTHAPLPPAPAGDGDEDSDAVAQDQQPIIDVLIPEKDAEGNMFVTALYDHTAEGAVELTFRVGDCIRVLETTPEGWWKGELNGVLGWFPGNYCGPKRTSPAPAAHPELDELLVLTRQNADLKNWAASVQTEEITNGARESRGEVLEEKNSKSGMMRRLFMKDVHGKDEKSDDGIIR